MTFVNEVLGSQTTERVLLPQLADSIDGFASGALYRSFCMDNCLLREHFLDKHFERHPSRLGLCRQPIRYIYLDFHTRNFTMRRKTDDGLWELGNLSNEVGPCQARFGMAFSYAADGRFSSLFHYQFRTLDC